MWVTDTVTKVARQWKDHRAFEDFGLEDAILKQLGHIEFTEAMHPRKTRNSLTSTQWLTLVTHLMSFVFQQARGSKQTYDTFVQKVFPAGIAADKVRDRIVTFNYDTLVDEHIVTRFGTGRTYFDKIADGHDGASGGVKFEFPLLLKLHGSVNWRCSTEDFERLLSEAPTSGPYRSSVKL